MWSVSSASTSSRSGRAATRASAYPMSPSPESTTATRTQAASVHLGVSGIEGDELERVALAAQHVLPERLGRGDERVAGFGLDDEPVAARDLAFQLTGVPPGIPGEHPHSRQMGGDDRRRGVEVNQTRLPEQQPD